MGEQEEPPLQVISCVSGRPKGSSLKIKSKSGLRIGWSSTAELLFQALIVNFLYLRKEGERKREFSKYLLNELMWQRESMRYAEQALEDAQAPHCSLSVSCLRAKGLCRAC